MATALYSFGTPVARRSPYSLDFQCRISTPIRQPERQHEILKPSNRARGARKNGGNLMRPLDGANRTQAGSLCYITPSRRHSGCTATSSRDGSEKLLDRPENNVAWHRLPTCVLLAPLRE